ncbi:MAG: hypothetical protein J6Y94_01370, partial [Bacteriovoracaceae bacterium]|nr:hypothetical protein [Bacteriovoracaceae bacterium]
MIFWQRQWGQAVVFGIMILLTSGGMGGGLGVAAAHEKYPTLFTDHNLRPNRPWRHIAAQEQEALLALLEILQ